jgi:glyoxylase-like metal-dependent hydrolase (beta-lactamase superfamily II)
MPRYCTSFTALYLLLLVIACPPLVAGSHQALPDYPAEEVAPGVFVIHGPLGIPSVQNRGFINNPAFVLGDTGVVVIDPGSSLEIGQMVLRQIERLTDLPVVAVFNTHIHGDHWLANQAFRQRYPEVPIFGHDEMHRLIEKGEGQAFLAMLMRMTEGAVAGTEEVPPDRRAAHADELTFGGLAIRIYYQAKAHSHSDIMLELPGRKVLFLGDNVMNSRLGQMDSATFSGNIAAIDMALATQAEVFVPGHGQTGGREVPQRYREYLSRLKRLVATYYDEGLSDFEMKPQVVAAMGPYRDWVDFEHHVGRHISLAYLEVESELF